MFERIFGGKEFFFIAGPCVIESWEVIQETVVKLKEICKRLGVNYIFKSSYYKDNRTSLSSYRGPGLEEGLKVLGEVKSKYELPVLTDVHEVRGVEAVKDVVDVIQIPAFLCRQTDLILAVSNTGKTVNIKKGQFLAPFDVKNIIDKFVSTGNKRLMITERGTSFGYNNLVVDFRSFPIMASFGYPIVFDVTHSLQLPGGQGSSSGGQREYVSYLARAGAAVGISGIFMEVHPDPERALCDGPNMVKLEDVEDILKDVVSINKLLKSSL